jgi:uncharacterized protein (DUF433 family)
MKGGKVAELDLLAMTRERAAKLTGLTLRQLDYWDDATLVGPSMDQRLTPHRRSRLYEYGDLMALLVVVELRDRRVSLQHIRAIVTRLRQRGFSEPLTQLRYATHNSRVYVQFEDGTWESGDLPGQAIIYQAIDLEPLRARLRAAGERPTDTFGKISKRRGAMGSKPLIAGTRVPVETITRYLEHGASTAEVLTAYPILVAADVEAVRRELAA